MLCSESTFIFHGTVWEKDFCVKSNAYTPHVVIDSSTLLITFKLDLRRLLFGDPGAVPGYGMTDIAFGRSANRKVPIGLVVPKALL